ncbi:hypothetical protein Ddye_013099 [Dipteronia dyeriana]|uniref:Uncharacterized protein n=1 Tax=Dipteronia dyeriana TaxID=168575 RepID=A0AAD9X5X8_9ROSI|nr:hypothetical protein Ddye_013099 [Dipteronia dyeriana]
MLQLFFAVAFSAVPLTLYVPPIRSLNLFVETIEDLFRQTSVYTLRAYPRFRSAFSRIVLSLFRLPRLDNQSSERTIGGTKYKVVAGLFSHAVTDLKMSMGSSQCNRLGVGGIRPKQGMLGGHGLGQHVGCVCWLGWASSVQQQGHLAENKLGTKTTSSVC